MPDPDTKRDADDLPVYNRPEMPWEREATPMPGRGSTAMVSEFSITMALFMGLGWWLDSQWGTSPWLLVGGAALGMTIGIYRLATAGARALRREEQRERGESPKA